jgi:hypothetical protein
MNSAKKYPELDTSKIYYVNSEGKAFMMDREKYNEMQEYTLAQTNTYFKDYTVESWYGNLTAQGYLSRNNYRPAYSKWLDKVLTLHYGNNYGWIFEVNQTLFYSIPYFDDGFGVDPTSQQASIYKYKRSWVSSHSLSGYRFFPLHLLQFYSTYWENQFLYQNYTDYYSSLNGLVKSKSQSNRKAFQPKEYEIVRSYENSRRNGTRVDNVTRTSTGVRGSSGLEEKTNKEN